METATVTPLFSPAFQEIKCYLSGVQTPYTLQDIRGFNALYKRHYASLSREEKRRTESFVDRMIENVAEKKLAAHIFGVV